jgi:hypothetical protein
MRWAEIPKPGDDFTPIADDSTPASLVTPSEFDDPKYNYLGNPFSAHVNPVFWKLHGWVDHVIVNWLQANNYSEISSHCEGKRSCYQWKSQWVGAMHSRLGSPHKHPTPAGGADVDRALKKILKKASFRNRKFDDIARTPRVGGPRGGHGPSPLEDPIKFVEQTGPCSN